ncbi:MAG TPA: sigma-70 family RNA polymerase sigma factor [Candidatus Polarisedimenticolia bacterium]|nr:sigma-70 family RNA polymerase sigma factor [Candidatus Polarisedimenticolia bacterium]
MNDTGRSTDAAAQALDLESTASLLARVRSGEPQARERLVVRYLDVLQRWAHRRLPVRTRDFVDTDDLVQDTLLRALDKVESFEPRREGAFLAYLRRILVNQIRDQIRRFARRPAHEEVVDKMADASLSPLETAIGREAFASYNAALMKLTEEEQEAVILRIEMGLTHQQVAEALEKPTSDSARMCVARALIRLAEIMDEGQG